LTDTRQKKESDMKLRVGQSLSSVVDATTLIVVRSPDADVALTCGGHDLASETPPALRQPVSSPAAREGLLLGKRYTAIDLDLELLCVRPGTFPVEVDGTALAQKAAKPLPASD
jgi:hypothetical protein